MKISKKKSNKKIFVLFQIYKHNSNQDYTSRCFCFTIIGTDFWVNFIWILKNILKYSSRNWIQSSLSWDFQVLFILYQEICSRIVMFQNESDKIGFDQILKSSSKTKICEIHTFMIKLGTICFNFGIQRNTMWKN